jgi:molybdenum cofactor biosynthesis enzyme
MDELTHYSDAAHARMGGVSEKPATHRATDASGVLRK